MTQSVVEVIDHVLELLGQGSQNIHCRYRLQSIRDGIFLELPEERAALLCQVGRVINDCVPSGDAAAGGWIEDYWYQIRDFLDGVFRPAMTPRQDPE